MRLGLIPQFVGKEFKLFFKQNNQEESLKIEFISKKSGFP